MIKKWLRGKEFRVRVADAATDKFGYEREDMDEQDPADIVSVAQGVADVVTSTAVTIFTLAAAYKVLDTVCKVIVKKA